MTPRAAELICDAAADLADEQIASRGALLEQEHQLNDPAVPPLGWTMPTAPREG